MTRSTARALDRRTLLRLGVAAPAAVAGTAVVGGSLSAASAAPTFDRALATGLDYPWGIAFLPDGDALVSERNSGRILRVAKTGGATSVGTLPDAYNDGGEGGLMGLALSPSFAADGLLFAFLTTRTDNRVVKMTYDGRGLGPAQPVLLGIPRGRTHNGGGLWFARQSLLVTTGDTRDRTLPQDKSSLAGKILRIDANGRAWGTNPFGNRVYSRGHRNPEGIVQGADGRVWASELGENTWDEMNRINKGSNYGWPRVEGRDGRGGYFDPFVVWHPADCSPSGIAVTSGHAWVGALRGQCLWSVDIDGAGAQRKVRYFYTRFGRIRNVKKAPDGSLWLTTSNGGGTDRVLRVTV